MAEADASAISTDGSAATASDGASVTDTRIAPDAHPLRDAAAPLDARSSPDVPGVTFPEPVACNGIPGLNAKLSVGGFHSVVGFYDVASATLFSVPESLTPALERVSAVRFEGASPSVVALPVRWATSTKLRGTVAGVATWVPAIARHVFSVSTSNSVELVTAHIAGDEVVLAHLTSSPFSSLAGFGVNGVFTRSNGVLVERTNRAFEVTIDVAAGTATWGEGGTIVGAPALDSLVDGPGAQTLFYGFPDVSTPGALRLGPALSRRGAGEMRGGTVRTTNVNAPPTVTLALGARPWLAFDGAGDRLFVALERPVRDTRGVERSTPGLWSVPVAGGDWTLHQESYAAVPTAKVYASDSINRRVFTFAPIYGIVQEISVAPSREGVVSDVASSRNLATADFRAACEISGGRILGVSLADRYLQTFDPATNLWTRFGSAQLTGASEGYSMHFDAARDRVIVVGGRAGTTLLTISGDGSSITESPTTGAAFPARANHGAVTMGNTVVVAGGLGIGPTPGVLNDVWSLDLATLAWSRIGTLPGPRANPMLLPRPSSNEVWIAGGVSDMSFTHERTVVSMNLATGATTPVTTTGTWPFSGLGGYATLGDSIVRIDTGERRDHAERAIFQLVPTSATTAEWKNGDACAPDSSFGSMIGVSSSNGAWFVGRDTWRITAAP